MRQALGIMALAVPAGALADSPTPPQVAPAAAGCLGRWAGVGRNAQGPPWSIAMRVTAERGARCGTIEYPSLGCGGELVDCRRAGDAVIWREVYTHNPGACAPAGVIRGRCEGDAMAWTWTGSEVIRARLRRAE